MKPLTMGRKAMVPEHHWAPRNSFLDPIPELDEAADLLSEAADRLLADDNEGARESLLRANMPRLRAFAASVMGKLNPEIHRLREVPNRGPKLIAAESSERMPPRAEKERIFRRDGYRCRYCSCRIISPEAQRVISKALPGVVRWGRKDAELNAAFYTLKGVLDHVVPYAFGGGSDPENLVTSCQPCNYGKDKMFLEQIGIRDPRRRPPLVDGWDGLTRILKLPAQTVTAPKKSSPPPSGGLHIDETVILRASRSTSIDEWVQGLSEENRSSVQALLSFIEENRDLGVSFSAKDVLTVKVNKGDAKLTVFGVMRDGEVQVPWYAGSQKSALRPFTEILSASIPYAECYETPKMWRVRKHGRQIRIEDLIQAGSALKLAFEALYAALPEAL